MRNTGKNRWEPSEGYKYLTNGEVYAESIYLGQHDNISNWRDTNDEPMAEEPEE